MRASAPRLRWEVLVTEDWTDGGPAKPSDGNAKPLAFFSYSRGDRALAKPVIDALNNSGVEVWWDGPVGWRRPVCPDH